MEGVLKTIKISEAIELLSKGQKIKADERSCSQCENNEFIVKLLRGRMCVVKCSSCPTRITLTEEVLIQILP